MTSPRSALPLALLSVLGLLSNIGCSFISDPPAPRKIVLITIDTLRADHLGYMGHDRAFTPTLDRLAKEGASFSNFYATSSTTPMSMGTLFSGLHPFSHGFTYGSLDGHGYSLSQPILSDELLLLPEFLNSKGHLGFGVATNPHLTAKHGFAQGLQELKHTGSYSQGTTINFYAPISAFKEALAKGDTAPFFWAHYMDPHDPWWDNGYYRDVRNDIPSPERLKPYAKKPMIKIRKEFSPSSQEDSKYIKWLYDCEVARVDRHIGKLLTLLEADENTLTIITSDHGESFGEHGSFGHGYSLFEDLTHIPLILHWPKGIQGGQDVSTLASLVDIYPTIVDLLGHKPPEHLHGESLAPLVIGKDHKHLDNRALFADLNNSGPGREHAPPTQLTSIRQGPHKLIVNHHPPEPTLSLYNVIDDPAEIEDLSQGLPDLAQALADALQAHRRALPPPPNAEPLQSSDRAEIEALKAMGYIE